MIDRMGIIRHPTIKYWSIIIIVRVSSFVHVSTHLSVGDIYLYQSVGCDSTWLLKHYPWLRRRRWLQPFTTTHADNTDAHTLLTTFIHSFIRSNDSIIHQSWQSCIVWTLHNSRHMCIYISPLDSTASWWILSLWNVRTIDHMALFESPTSTPRLAPFDQQAPTNLDSKQFCHPQWPINQSFFLSFYRLFVRCILPTSLD